MVWSSSGCSEVAHEFQDFFRRKGRSERIPDGFRRRRDQGVP